MIIEFTGNLVRGITVIIIIIIIVQTFVRLKFCLSKALLSY